MVSVFDIFKIGIGPSSSHTVGPMKAGNMFTDDLVNLSLISSVDAIIVDVYGSLALTGKGHHTDIAIIMGLAGNLPDSVDIDAIPAFIQQVQHSGRLPLLNGRYEVNFPLDSALRFQPENLPLHENGMTIRALDASKNVLYSKTYYSIGGGFVVDQEHFGQPMTQEERAPWPFYSARQLLQHCHDNCLSLSAVVMKKRNRHARPRCAGNLFRQRLANHAKRHSSRYEYRGRTSRPTARATSCLGVTPFIVHQRALLQ
ncbi:hypothetical protein DZJ_42200 [Dickeya ananatis]